jgi:transposase
MQVIKTYSYRIKDSSSREHLCRMAGAVNFVWNYCNEVANEMWGRQRRWVTAFDLNNLTSGAAKELPINSQTIQAVAKEYVTRRDQFHKRKLRWRSKKNLGWIPFNGQTVALAGDSIKYRGRVYRFWQSRPIPEGAKLVTGSFNQDGQGRWYVNLQLKFEVDEPQAEGERRIGIDLGLKTQATCSDGEKLERPNLTKEW